MPYQEHILNAENRLSVRVLKKGTVFRFPGMRGSYLFYLREGLLKISVVHVDGKEVIRCLVKKGDFFGEAALLHEEEHAGDYAVALEDSEVSLLDAGRVRQHMLTHPDLRAFLYQQLIRRLRRAEERLLSVLFKDAETRVREFLCGLVLEMGHRTARGYELKNCLTHDDIARLSDTCRQTVSRVLGSLREQKLIHYNHEVIRIPYDSPLLPHRQG